MRILEKLLVRKQQILLFEGLGSINLKKKKKINKYLDKQKKKRIVAPADFILHAQLFLC